MLICWQTCLLVLVFNMHVGRDGNYVAHNLARHARHVTSFSDWMEDVPIQIFATYQADFSIT